MPRHGISLAFIMFARAESRDSVNAVHVSLETRSASLLQSGEDEKGAIYSDTKPILRNARAGEFNLPSCIWDRLVQAPDVRRVCAPPPAS